jgi:hypothetical protein
MRSEEKSGCQAEFIPERARHSVSIWLPGHGANGMKTTQMDVVDPIQAFRGLSPEECRQLREWRVAARAIGVDTVEDLSERSWPCSIDGALIGVFLAGRHAASWMVVKHNGQWAVAHCGDLTVSRPVGSLAEALEHLHPSEPGPGARK